MNNMTYSNAIVSEQLADLAEIYQESVNVCVVKRTVSKPLQQFIDSVLADSIAVNVVQHFSIDQFEFTDLIPKLSTWAGYQDFCQDIQHLARLFGELFELEQIGLRLATLDKAMCPKFHVDAVPCRLVSTYGGLGTEWLNNRDVDRSKLGQFAHQAVLNEHAIETMPAFAIGLLKGSGWEGNELNGAVHRSPSLNATAPRRLLLTLDFG